MKFTGKVYVMPRKDLLDPQGGAIKSALHQLGFKSVTDVRVGKEIDIVFEADDGDTAISLLNDICEKLLVNPITEDFDYLVLTQDEEEGENS